MKPVALKFKKMAKQHIVTELTERWRDDLSENFKALTSDPLARGPGRRWDRDFSGEIRPDDVRYSVFIVVLTLVPAAIVAYASVEPRWKMMAQLFGAPLHAVISGFLTSALIFLGSHVNRVSKPFPVAYKLMLRIMAIYPLLGILLLNQYGQVAVLLIYGLFVVRGVRKTYPITLQNALLFFGVIYFVFALFQLQALVNPRPPGPRTFSSEPPVARPENVRSKK